MDRELEFLADVLLILVFFHYWFITIPLFLIHLIIRGFTNRDRKPKKKSSGSWSECRKKVNMCSEYRETPEGQEKHRIYIAAFDADHVRRKAEIKDIKGSFIIDTMAKRYLCWVAQQSYQDPDVCKARDELRKAEHAYIKNHSTES